MKKTTQLEQWQELAKKFSLVPLNGKAPFEKEWPQWCRKKREFDEKDFEGRNAGVACGPASGVIVLDVDDEKKFREIGKTERWILPRTYTVKTGTGKHHYYYAYPKDGKEYGCGSLKDPSDKDKTIFDIKGIGGQVVAPGSVHPVTGKPYRIFHDIKLSPPPPWLLKWVSKNGTPPEGSPPMETPIEWDGDLDSLRVSEKVKKLITEGKPNGERSEAIRTVLRGLIKAGLDDKEVFQIFDEYPIGEKYKEQGEEWFQGEIDRARARIEAEENGKAKNKQEAPLYISAAELFSTKFKKVESLIAGIMRSGDSMLISGESYLGKSRIAANLAVALACGDEFLGRTVKGKHRVLILQSENSPTRMRLMLRRIAKAHKKMNSVKRNVFIMGNGKVMGDIHDKKFQARIREALDQTKADVLIVDPISSYMGGKMSENDNTQVRNALDTFSSLTWESGGSVIVIHHHGKVDTREGPKQARGASSFTNWPRAQLTLNWENVKKGIRKGQWDVNDFPKPADVYFTVSNKDIISVVDELLPYMQAMVEALEERGNECESKDALYKAVKGKMEAEGGKAPDKKLRESLEKLEKRGRVEFTLGPHGSLSVKLIRPL